MVDQCSGEIFGTIGVPNPRQIKRGSYAMGRAFATAVFSVIHAVFPTQAADNMTAFPPAEKGLVRHVLKLPKQDDEFAFRVELIVGKTVQVDDVNT